MVLRTVVVLVPLLELGVKLPMITVLVVVPLRTLPMSSNVQPLTSPPIGMRTLTP
jgi:hypothetical protein